MARRKAKAGGQASRERPGTLDGMLPKLREEDSERPAGEEQAMEPLPAEEPLDAPDGSHDWSYLLAVFEWGYEHKLEGFIGSLPADAECVLKASGYASTLESVCHRLKRSDEREFLIIRASSFDDLDLEYFASSGIALVREIPDRLKVRYRLKVQDTDMATGAYCEFGRQGTISEAIALYEREAARDPRAILLESLSCVDFVWDYLTRKTWFGLGKLEILPTYVEMGLETPDREYLLCTEGAKGPYTGKLDKSVVQLLGR